LVGSAGAAGVEKGADKVGVKFGVGVPGGQNWDLVLRKDKWKHG
jgi:hypothetical protein